jgi:lipoate-protein ligase A
MYSLILHTGRFPAVRHVATTHQFILSRVADAICQQDCHVQRAGTSDLVLSHDHQLLKCSGNSMRLGRQSVLYHGTLLYDLDLAVIPRWLRHPGREPSYRNGRTHEAFVTNLPLTRQSLCRALLCAFPAQGTCQGPDQRELAPLIAARYTDDAWNYCL